MKYLSLRKLHILTAACFCISAAALLSGCGIRKDSGSADSADAIITEDDDYSKTDDNDLNVADLQALYTDDSEAEAENKVRVIYLTIGRGSASRDTRHTWSEINDNVMSFYEENGLEPYHCEAVMQLGDEDGPIEGSFGYGDITANVMVRLQGSKASEKPQKSYRINVMNNKGSINGMKTLVLSKCFSDPYRFTNKLCFDLMRNIPGMFSTRISFVHLYVKDKSGDEADDKFRDYGLYSFTEPVNGNYLKKRGLNNDGILYKAEDFDFARHEDAIKEATDKNYSQAAFEEVLEIKDGSDHTKLIGMLNDINDESVSISAVIDKWFNKDNLYNWISFNLLMGNRDAADSGYYLYSPNGSNRFWFISWDNDSALGTAYDEKVSGETVPAYKKGYFPFVKSVLFRRIITDSACRIALEEHLDAMRENYLTDEALTAEAEKLAGLTRSYVYDVPDSAYARIPSSMYDELLADIPAMVEQNMYDFYQMENYPWPFNINDPVNAGSADTDGSAGRYSVMLSWETPETLEGGSINYHLELSDSWDFNNKILDEVGLEKTSYTAERLAPGEYFMRVTAVGENGSEQLARDVYKTEKKSEVYGVLCFYVSDEGNVQASRYKD